MGFKARSSQNVMKFVQTSYGNYPSYRCGDYEVWIQARPLHEGPYWAAAYKDEWLTTTETTKQDAIAVCEEHARRHQKSDGESSGR